MRDLDAFGVTLRQAREASRVRRVMTQHAGGMSQVFDRGASEFGVDDGEEARCDVWREAGLQRYPESLLPNRIDERCNLAFAWLLARTAL